jgi:hypothetical protein
MGNDPNDEKLSEEMIDETLAALGREKTGDPSGAEAQIGLKGLFLIFSVLIFDSSVDDGSPSLAAAPAGPDSDSLDLRRPFDQREIVFSGTALPVVETSATTSKPSTRGSGPRRGIPPTAEARKVM